MSKTDLRTEKNNNGDKLVMGGELLFKWNGEIVRGTIMEIRPGKLRVKNDAGIQCWVTRKSVLGWTEKMSKPVEWYFYKAMCIAGIAFKNMFNSFAMFDFWHEKILYNTDYNYHGEFSLRKKKING